MITLKPANSGGYRAYWENGAPLGDVFKGVDGYYVWWPENHKSGCYDQHFLHCMAEKLKELNAEWHEQVCRAMTGPSIEVTGREYVPPTDLSKEPF